MVLDLSYTKMTVSYERCCFSAPCNVDSFPCRRKVAAAFGFVDALDYWPHALRILNMSNCHLKKAAVAEIFNAFSRNLEMSLTLEELVFDSNEFDKVGLLTGTLLILLIAVKGRQRCHVTVAQQSQGPNALAEAVLGVVQARCSSSISRLHAQRHAED
jgi:hypothetical protein